MSSKNRDKFARFIDILPLIGYNSRTGYHFNISIRPPFRDSYFRRNILSSRSLDNDTITGLPCGQVQGEAVRESW